MEKEKPNTPDECPSCPVSWCEWEFASVRKEGGLLHASGCKEGSGGHWPAVSGQKKRAAGKMRRDTKVARVECNTLISRKGGDLTTRWWFSVALVSLLVAQCLATSIAVQLNCSNITYGPESCSCISSLCMAPDD